MQTATHTMPKSPKVKKIEDILKPDATMRLHQRLFDRRRKHHIDVREESGPGASLSAYLVSPKYRQEPTYAEHTDKDLVITTPAPVLQYSQITRELPEGNYLEKESDNARSFMDRIAQRYHVFVSQHKPFYYSLTNGMASGWLQNPRARLALAGSALALLLFFTNTPAVPPNGPNNPAGKNPIVIQDTSNGGAPASVAPREDARPENASSQPASPSTAQANTQQQTAPARSAQDTASSLVPANGGGYGSGPASSPVATAPTPTGQTDTSTQTPTSPNLIQDIIKPTPVTIPGQDIQLDDKRILQTTDTTITIN